MTNQQAPEIYALHTVPNEGETPWGGIYAVRADAERDAKVMRDATGRDWSVVRLVVADIATTPTGPMTEHDWRHSASYGGELCATCGAVKGTRRGRASCGTAQQPAPTPQADSQPAAVAGGYPPLPEPLVLEQGYAPGDMPDAYTADQMRAYVDADRAARAPAESVTAPAGGADWQDISTAPKDGTRFVAVGQNYGLDSEAQHTCIAQWLAGCWVEVSDWNGASKLKYLTHWMPLPPLPCSAGRAWLEEKT